MRWFFWVITELFYFIYLFICFVCLFDLVFDVYDQQLRLLTVSWPNHTVPEQASRLPTALLKSAEKDDLS